MGREHGHFTDTLHQNAAMAFSGTSACELEGQSVSPIDCIALTPAPTLHLPQFPMSFGRILDAGNSQDYDWLSGSRACCLLSNSAHASNSWLSETCAITVIASGVV